MIDWLFYVLASSTLLALAARAAEEVAALYGRPVRWAWVAALCGSCALPVLAAWSGARLVGWGAGGGGTAEVTAATPLPVAAGVVDAAAATVGAGSGRASEAERFLVRGWVACSVLALLVFAAGSVRLGRSRRRWRASRVCGVRVLVSRRSGPAVLGVVRPAIVVPDWLLTSGVGLRRMVVLHEGEHVRAQDSRLLAAGCVAVAAAPWNPVAWWMLFRLRAAIEVDCDRRVLCRGADAGAYGSMLLGAVRRATRLRFAVALKQPPSLIERRILAMTRMRPRFRAGRAFALAVAAAACMMGAYALEAPAPLAALEMLWPTDAAAPQEGTQETTVALPARVARELREAGTVLLPGMGVRVRLGSGVRAVEATPGAAAEPLMLVDDLIVGSGYFAPERLMVADSGAHIASVEVIKAGPDVALVGRAIVRVRTRPAPAQEAVRRQAEREQREVSGATVRVRGEASTGPPPLLVVDGVVLGRGSSPDDVGIDPSRIAEVSVLRGAAAVQLYGERAAGGVVVITTKRPDREAQAAARPEVRVEPAGTMRLSGLAQTVERSPLYIVDGVVAPVGTAQQIESVVPKERIRSIEVIKGAQAVSLYGARAAGGVISITTIDAPVTPERPPGRLEAERTVPASEVERTVQVIAVPAAIEATLRAEGRIPFDTKDGRVLLRVGRGVRLEAGSPPAGANDAIVVVDGVIVGLASQRGGGALPALEGVRIEDVESVSVVKRGAAEAAGWGWSFVFVTTRAGR